MSIKKASYLFVGASRGGEMMSTILEEAVGSKLNISFIDDNKKLWGCKIIDKPVLSLSTAEINTILNKYNFAFISIGLNKLIPFKKRIYSSICGKINLINIIHPTAYISETASVGEGNYFGAYSYVGPYTEIGNCNFFSANTIIEHHNTIGSFNMWGPSNTTSGMCSIGDAVCMGTGVTMIYHINIGDNSVIASDISLFKSIASDKIVRKKELKDIRVSKFLGW